MNQICLTQWLPGLQNGWHFGIYFSFLESKWQDIDIGSGGDLVLPGNKPLPEPMLTKGSLCHVLSLGNNELKR